MKLSWLFLCFAVAWSIAAYFKPQNKAVVATVLWCLASMTFAIAET